MKLLVTGSSGQIGSYVIDEARRRGWEARGFDLRASPWTEVTGDIRDAATVRSAAKGCDAIVHLAAQVSVQSSLADPDADARANILGSIAVLQAGAAAGIARMVTVSSAAVYGSPVMTPVTEEHPLVPLSPYGIGKLAAEHYSRVLAPAAEGWSVVVRPFNVYSPRQDPTNPYSGVLSKFRERVLAGEAPRVSGDGLQTRDFISATDVARALASLADPRRRAPALLNLGTGKETRILDLARMFLAAAGRPDDPIEHVAALPGEIRRSVADVTRMRSAGLNAEVSLEAGVRELLATGR